MRIVICGGRLVLRAWRQFSEEVEMKNLEFSLEERRPLPARAHKTFSAQFFIL